MNPRHGSRCVVRRPRAARVAVRLPRLVTLLAVLAALLLSPAIASAQERREKRKRNRQPPAAQTEKKEDPTATRRERGKEEVFDFTGLQLDASMRMPQLLYFLDRAAEELKRASLERRSFIPEMIRSVEEEAL
jgi:hypothetical protein